MLSLIYPSICLPAFLFMSLPMPVFVCLNLCLSISFFYCLFPLSALLSLALVFVPISLCANSLISVVVSPMVSTVFRYLSVIPGIWFPHYFSLIPACVFSAHVSACLSVCLSACLHLIHFLLL